MFFLRRLVLMVTYQNQRSSFQTARALSTRMCPGRWTCLLPDPRQNGPHDLGTDLELAATAILDRHLHHIQVVPLRGDSHRLRDRRQSDLLQRTAPANPVSANRGSTPGG